MQEADKEDSKSLWKSLCIEEGGIGNKVCSKNNESHAHHEDGDCINMSSKSHEEHICASSHIGDDSESVSTKSIGQDEDRHDKSCLNDIKNTDHFEVVNSRWAREFGRGLAKHHYRLSIDAMHERSCSTGQCICSDKGNLLKEFFLALDKFVYIANQCLKSTYIQDKDEDFNFALSWIRDAFQLLGIDGAKHYASNYSGPYNGWAVDIEFLMNRYFFSPEFNHHVNGVGIKEPMHEGCKFVESQSSNFCLSYVPYPGYYNADDDNKQFCSNCKLMLPLHLSSSRNTKNDGTNECSRNNQNNRCFLNEYSKGFDTRSD
ncbi:hypothetical protein OCOL_001153 [Ordospora colligata]|uniref:Uncharacterized protein n=1 Tax=Ordospora colligata OC4 TaxID=1354746 RepID=A0A0B2UHZ1_9MICR|nr:uncharacterized protein M896_120380 [Ordospora colligata OC4]KHN68819.1 hypothetical protein M896_120380 [Ordospora colligata OC4]TBU13853.1 hypothetical protein CWI40_120380 [Ordospora colligata]